MLCRPKKTTLFSRMRIFCKVDILLIISYKNQHKVNLEQLKGKNYQF